MIVVRNSGKESIIFNLDPVLLDCLGGKSF